MAPNYLNERADILDCSVHASPLDTFGSRRRPDSQKGGTEAVRSNVEQKASEFAKKAELKDAARSALLPNIMSPPRQTLAPGTSPYLSP